MLTWRGGGGETATSRNGQWPSRLRHGGEKKKKKSSPVQRPGSDLERSSHLHLTNRGFRSLRPIAGPGSGAREFRAPRAWPGVVMAANASRASRLLRVSGCIDRSKAEQRSDLSNGHARRRLLLRMLRSVRCVAAGKHPYRASLTGQKSTCTCRWIHAGSAVVYLCMTTVDKSPESGFLPLSDRTCLT